jgi:hypothetical protein
MAFAIFYEHKYMIAIADDLMGASAAVEPWP